MLLIKRKGNLGWNLTRTKRCSNNWAQLYKNFEKFCHLWITSWDVFCFCRFFLVRGNGLDAVLRVGNSEDAEKEVSERNWVSGPGVGGGYSLVTGLWRCAAGWGRTFTNGLTVMGLHFYKSYENGFAHCQDFGGQKIQACADLKIRRFTPH